MAGPFPPMLSVLEPRRPVHRMLLHELCERDARVRMSENAAVLKIAAQLGIHADDPAGLRIEPAPTVGDVRHLIRAADRREKDARK